MVTGEKRAKKWNFSDTETDTLVGEVEAQKTTSFGGHSSGITNKKKQHVAAAVNSVGGTEQAVPELKKSGSI